VQFTILDQPTVTSISPTSGPVGTTLTVTGTKFGASQGASTLSVNGAVASSISTWTDTQIVATVPVTATTGPVKVTVQGVDSNTVTFAVPPPVVSSISPLLGDVGTQVTVNGSGFQTSQRDSTVKFNNVTATVVSWSDRQILARFLPEQPPGR
jgi:hypothetical protein